MNGVLIGKKYLMEYLRMDVNGIPMNLVIYILMELNGLSTVMKKMIVTVENSRLNMNIQILLNQFTQDHDN
jgi:hypothetical protein